MRIQLLIKLFVASLCALFACWLPQSLSKPHEIATLPSKPLTAVQALQAPKLQLVSYLQPVAVKSAEPAPVAAPAPVSAPQSSYGGDSDKLWIYMHESGNNPSSVNSIGCRGLGQACPGDKLPCGADYACQDAWFTSYMLDRYGSWAAAKNFWVSHLYW